MKRIVYIAVGIALLLLVSHLVWGKGEGSNQNPEDVFEAWVLSVESRLSKIEKRLEAMENQTSKPTPKFNVPKTPDSGMTKPPDSEITNPSEIYTPKNDKNKCLVCNGAGLVACPYCKGTGHSSINCFSCKGTGKNRFGACYSCNGRGFGTCYGCSATGLQKCIMCDGKGEK